MPNEGEHKNSFITKDKAWNDRVPLGIYVQIIYGKSNTVYPCHLFTNQVE